VSLSAQRAEAKWLTLPETAEYLAVSVLTVRRYITAGRLRAMRVGPRMIRVDRDSVEALGSPVETAGSR
jgi:excisionase family DNA binding protein